MHDHIVQNIIKNVTLKVDDSKKNRSMHIDVAKSCFYLRGQTWGYAPKSKHRYNTLTRICISTLLERLNNEFLPREHPLSALSSLEGIACHYHGVHM
jgi:hypothetical protein